MDSKLFDKLQAGRRAYQEERTKRRIEYESMIFAKSAMEVESMTRREFFIAGIVLYWAEGFKHSTESTLGLATLDPKMAKFYTRWLSLCLGIERNNLYFRVTTNVSLANKVKGMEAWWANYLEVDISQFHKPFFQRTKQSRVYPKTKEYHGVVRIRVARGTTYLRRMRGWLSGVPEARVDDKI